MSESRVFMLNGVELPAVVNRLENFFRGEKGMEGNAPRPPTDM